MIPLVSILVPAHNAEATIGETLRSAMAQTWPKTEIIVVDDGSRDRTADVVTAVGGSQVQVIRQENRGAAAARNRAYASCRGDLVQWLDADDLLAPDKVRCQVEALDHCPSQRTLASGAWGWFMHRPRKAVFRPTALWCDQSPTEWLLRKMRDNLHMQTATWLVTRELTDAAGPWNTALHVDDDGEYFCRVLLASDGVRFVPDAWVYYRMSGSGRLSYIGGSDRKLEAQLASMRLHVGYLRSLEDSSRVRTACGSYLQTWLPYFYDRRPDLVGELERLAAEVGATLRPPTVSWKYEWLRRACGWRAARRLEAAAQRVRWSLARAWDRMQWHIEGRSGG